MALQLGRLSVELIPRFEVLFDTKVMAININKIHNFAHGNAPACMCGQCRVFLFCGGRGLAMG
jgi:hypothetical protein